MNFKNIIAISLLCIVTGLIYFFNSVLMHQKDIKKEVQKHTLFIQGVCNAPMLEDIKKQVSVLVNKIIHEELSTHFNNIDDLFLPKNEERLTLYSLSNVLNQNIDAVTSKLNDLIIAKKEKFKVNHLSLMPDVRLFGENKDELVILIKDDFQELAFLNEYIKISMHELNKSNKDIHGIDIYNSVKSEQFDYLPHIGIGRIRTTSLKYYLESVDVTQVDVIFERIMGRIKKESLSLVEFVLNEHNNAILTFKEVCVFEVPSRTIIWRSPFIL